MRRSMNNSQAGYLKMQRSGSISPLKASPQIFTDLSTSGDYGRIMKTSNNSKLNLVGKSGSKGTFDLGNTNSYGDLAMASQNMREKSQTKTYM